MKLKALFPIVAAGVMASSAASAQVSVSFDNIVDQVLTDDNGGNLFSGAVNLAGVDASVDISVNVSALNSTSSSSSGGEGSFSETIDLTDTLTDVSASSSSGGGTGANDVFGLGASDVSGSATFTDLQTSISSFTSNSTSASSSTLSTVVSNFGAVTVIAAGAVNDVEISFTQDGDEATVLSTYSAGNVASSVDAQNFAGADIGIMNFALNTAEIDGKFTANLTNNAGLAESISTTAVGALNAGSVTAVFVGSSLAEASADNPGGESNDSAIPPG
jgi:hypothetical protein